MLQSWEGDQPKDMEERSNRMDTSIIGVLAGVAIPAITIAGMTLFALYWVVRKAVRDAIRDVTQESKK